MLLGLLVHILFHKFKEKTIFSLVPRYYGLWLLQTLNPPTVTVITEVDCNYKLLKSDWLPVINYRLISHLLNHHPATYTNIRTLLKTTNKNMNSWARILLFQVMSLNTDPLFKGFSDSYSFFFFFFSRFLNRFI